jgi:hypothetical protein
MSERDKVQGARNADTEIVRGVQRGFEYRATQQFASIANYSAYP